MTTSQLKTRIEPTLQMSCSINYASMNNAQHNCAVLNQTLSKPSESHSDCLISLISQHGEKC